MAGVVTVSFKSTVTSEDEARNLVNSAQSEIDSYGEYGIFAGRIAHLAFVSFEETEQTMSLTRSDLDALIKSAVDTALGARTTGAGDRPSGFDA